MTYFEALTFFLMSFTFFMKYFVVAIIDFFLQQIFWRKVKSHTQKEKFNINRSIAIVARHKIFYF
jgi:hypothetical protein